LCDDLPHDPRSALARPPYFLTRPEPGMLSVA